MGRPLTWSIIFCTSLLSGCATVAPQSEPVVNVDVKPVVPLVAVLPHHDVVKTQRQNLLKTLAERSQPDTIILVSPNHFGAGFGSIQTTDRIWRLTGDTDSIQPDTTVINNLVNSQAVSLEDSTFNNEHGIKNILSDLHTSFPEAKLIPLVLKDTVTTEQITTLTQQLVESCNDCGLIASVDMSHYNPAAVADMHDTRTLRDLQQLDDTDIWKTEVDSPASLALLLAWVKQQKVKQFVLTDHTNSGSLVGDNDGETTSHIMGYYQAGKISETPNIITFTLAGDMMLGREIGYQFQNNNFKDLFTNFGERVFWGTDIAWANLEGPVSNQTITQERQPADLTFLFSNQALEALKYLRLTTVGLANNHTANHGQAGLQTTRELLDNAGIDWVGDPSGVSDTYIKRYMQGDITISLIAVNGFDGDLTGLTDLIQQENQSGNFVIVIPHWGNEYQTTHSAKQEQLATTWFEAGTDLIIGMHPHVVQDAQVIDNKLVIYSLGNFVFDQTFSKETQQGLLVTGSITDDTLKLVLVPLVSRKLKPELARGLEKQDLIDRVCKNIQEYCKDGVISITN